MGLRQHLVTMHSDAAEHHRDCAKAHDVYSKTLDDGPEKEFHKTMRDRHVAAGEKCVARARSASTMDDSIATGDAHGPRKVTLPGADRFTKDATSASEVAGVHGGVPEGFRLIGRHGSPTEADLEKTEQPSGPAFERRQITA